MVIRHHEEQRQKEERARREEQAKLRRIASTMAKDVRQFWSNVEKVVQFKQQSRLEEKRKKALDLHLDFIVGQTEKYSDLLSQSLNQPLASSKASSSPCLGSSSAASSPPPPVSRLDDEGVCALWSCYSSPSTLSRAEKPTLWLAGPVDFVTLFSCYRWGLSTPRGRRRG